jgi:molybdate transport system substrate-binding protein
MRFSGTDCFAPCACTRATAAKHIRKYQDKYCPPQGRESALESDTAWHDEIQLPASAGDEGKQRKAAWMYGNGSLREKAVSRLGTTERAGPVQFAFWSWKSYRESTNREDNLDKMRHFRSAFLAVCLLLATAPGFAQEGKKSPSELVVAAAADLSTALPEIGNGYQKKTGVKLKLSFGASGALTQQIQNGAPFDLFFSADMDYPRQLIAAGDADTATLYQYAVGKLVLWVPADSPLDVEHQGMNVLLDPSVKKIAIANPQHAPYGRAAMAALQHSGLYDRVADRLVLGENVSQAAQFAESGNAQAGFVALAHAVAPGMLGKGKYWEVPAESYPRLAQGVVVLSHSPHKKEAADFLNYIKTKEAADLFQKYGFILP